MQVKLAGYNVDADALRDALKEPTEQACGALTPETLSAAYARISRSPDAVDVLRIKARQDVAKARESNAQIVFGYGHQSIAEHAVLNFDIQGVSRLAIEAIEQHRLCSVTEKSQRYQRITRDEVVLPFELHEVKEAFWALIEQQFVLYQRLCAELPPAAGVTPEEDARYVLPLAMTGQLGLTINARELGHMIRTLKAHALFEVRNIGQALETEAKTIIPSLIRYTDPESITVQRKATMARVCGIDPLLAVRMRPADGDDAPVSVKCLANYDEFLVAAALLHEVSGQSLRECYRMLSERPLEGDVRELFTQVLSHLEPHSAVPRAFELVHLLFEVVVSASCFAQLKRHRMATLLPQPYHLPLGYVIPPRVRQAGLASAMARVIEATDTLYLDMYRQAPAAVDYILTSAHRRRVLFQANARELYAFSRLRQDECAQWEIRALADAMMEQANFYHSRLFLMACGKNGFDQTKQTCLKT